MSDLTQDDTIAQIIEAADPEVILMDLYQLDYVNMNVDLVTPLGLLTDEDLQIMFAKHVLAEGSEEETTG